MHYTGDYLLTAEYYVLTEKPSELGNRPRTPSIKLRRSFTGARPLCVFPRQAYSACYTHTFSARGALVKKLCAHEDPLAAVNFLRSYYLSTVIHAQGQKYFRTIVIIRPFLPSFNKRALNKTFDPTLFNSVRETERQARLLQGSSQNTCVFQTLKLSLTGCGRLCVRQESLPRACAWAPLHPSQHTICSYGFPPKVTKFAHPYHVPN